MLYLADNLISYLAKMTCTFISIPGGFRRFFVNGEKPKRTWLTQYFAPLVVYSKEFRKKKNYVSEISLNDFCASLKNSFSINTRLCVTNSRIAPEG